MSKKTDRARRRAARYAYRDRQARTAAERHEVASGYLLAAVKHAAGADREARGLAAEYAPVVHDLVEASGVSSRRARLYGEQLDIRRDPRSRLAQTLRLLRAAADHHPQADQVHAYYAGELADAARRIDARHLRRMKGGEPVEPAT